jgi:hypothetical protein
MPRPKSELTTTQKQIGAKLTQWQYEEWKEAWRIKVAQADADRKP